MLLGFFVISAVVTWLLLVHFGHISARLLLEAPVSLALYFSFLW